MLHTFHDDDIIITVGDNFIMEYYFPVFFSSLIFQFGRSIRLNNLLDLYELNSQILTILYSNTDFIIVTS